MTAGNSTILVVDNEESVTQLLTLILESEGYTVLIAKTGSESLRMIDSDNPDLIILELTLPDKSGEEVVRAIRERDDENEIPIIVLTTLARPLDLVSALEAGADDYITKPFILPELLARIRALLRRSSLTQGVEQNDPNAVTMHFNFPEPVKVACEQYLLYFIEFLRDIGIEATASLKEEAGHVLFAVTPKGKEDALDNIREALDIYLHLPMHQGTTIVISPETSIEAQKLSAQLGFLQSQLQLANAAIQQNAAAIQQRDVVIQQQQSLIASGQIFIQTLQKEVEEDDAEPLVGDIVKVKPWSVESIPFEIDLPMLLRRLKEKFGRKRIP